PLRPRERWLRWIEASPACGRWWRSFSWRSAWPVLPPSRCGRTDRRGTTRRPARARPSDGPRRRRSPAPPRPPPRRAPPTPRNAEPGSARGEARRPRGRARAAEGRRARARARRRPGALRQARRGPALLREEACAGRQEDGADGALRDRAAADGVDARLLHDE